MKTIKYLAAAVALLFGLTACDKDGDIITTSGADAITLTGSGDVVLDQNAPNSLALTLNWTDNSRMSLSDDRVQAAKNATTNTLQFSNSADFSTVGETITDKGQTSIQFDATDLNAIATQVGLPTGTASPLYIRMKSELANNVEAKYSNVLVVNVTPYEIDMTYAYILDSANKEATGQSLASPDKDGVYSGFIGATAWMNYWLKEGDGTIWGNDGVTGTPFVISKETTAWNFWYPGLTGCYYTIVNTKSYEWSALYIPSLSVTGDIEGDMTYDRKTNKWSLTFNASSAGTKTIQIAGTGAQYNVATGTSDDAAVATAVAFGQSDGKLTFGTEAGNISVDVTAAGQMTLTLDLNDPLNWTCTIEAGAEPEVTVYDKLYVVGIDDGLEGGSWKFDQTIPLTNEETLKYAGAVNVNSLWGYGLYPEDGNWSLKYVLSSGEALSGTLAANEGSNIPAPDAGLYLMQVSLEEMTYSLTAINSVQITGLNNDWSLTEMTSTGTAGEYTADIAITASTEWGYQILINGEWSPFFGGTADKLVYGGGNIPFDDAYIGSTVHITVNLCKGTVTITK